MQGTEVAKAPFYEVDANLLMIAVGAVVHKT